MTGPDAGVPSIPMAELAVSLHSLDPDTPEFQVISEEVLRRWNAAGEQHALSRQAFGDETRSEQFREGYQPELVEEARQFLGVQTLIHERWVLQEAGVEPALLFCDPASTEQVWTILGREQDRAELERGPDGELLADADPGARAIDHLTYWSTLALFGSGESLVQDQRRLAGQMMEEIVEGRFRLCRQYLAQLHGSWSLDAVIAQQVGKAYHGPLDPLDNELRLGLDVALGRPGDTVTDEQVYAAYGQTKQLLAAEMARVAREDPPEPIGDLGPNYRTLAQRQSLHETMQGMADFLTLAVSVASLAADRVVRVDGRPVPRENVPAVLAAHRDSVQRLVGYHGTLSVAGLRITFENDPTGGPVAIVDAAGAKRRFQPDDSLAQILAVTTEPRPLPYVAKMRVGFDALGERLAAESRASAARGSSALRQRPGTPAQRAVPPPGARRRANGR
jgi:hypothetical protein